MKASAARDIVFAHAIETAPAHEDLPTAARCAAITEQVLHAQGSGGKAAGTAFAAFLQQRAARIIAQARLPADIRQLWQRPARVPRWAVAAMLAAAFAVGFAGHRIADPHRVDLLSPALIGIVLWNLLVYAVLLAGWLRGLLRRRPEQAQALQSAQEGEAAAAAAPVARGLPAHRWLRRLQSARLPRGTGLRRMALAFERNWWRLSRRARHAQWLAWLHLAAALLAAGALASLWLTGLTRSYQIGWESTFLSPAAVQQGLNLLFAPVRLALGTPPWSEQDIQALQGWMGAAAGAMGQGWVLAYTALLALAVVLPRLLLALWQGARAWWLARHMQLPWQQPYFLQLQRDWAGRATVFAVLPYSLEVTPGREAAVQAHVARTCGVGAQVVWLPALAYGAQLPAHSGAPAGAQCVALFNMAATPEPQIHGLLLEQARERWGAHAEVWLWAGDFAARNAGAPGRVRERERLWQEFVRGAGLHASLVPGEAA